MDKKNKPSSYVSRKNVDLDTVRRKAYGDINIVENEINEYVDENNAEQDENLLFDMTSEHTMPVVNQVTIADAEEYFEDLGLEYNIDYKDEKYEKATGRRTSKVEKQEIEETTDEEDANLEDNLFDLIDSMYEDGDE